MCKSCTFSLVRMETIDSNACGSAEISWTFSLTHHLLSSRVTQLYLVFLLQFLIVAGIDCHQAHNPFAETGKALHWAPMQTKCTWLHAPYLCLAQHSTEGISPYFILNILALVICVRIGSTDCTSPSVLWPYSWASDSCKILLIHIKTERSS